MDKCLIFGTLVRLNNVNSHPIKLTVTIKLCGGNKGNLGISTFQFSWNVILVSSTFSFLPSWDVKSLTHFVSARAHFSGWWWLRAIFRSSCFLPLSSPSPLHLCSVHHFIILRRALLTSETPLCTQVLLKTQFTSASVCGHVCAHVCVCLCWI